MDEYYIGVGRICMAWAHFETGVNHMIWRLANVEQYIGACITAQFIAPAPRLLALAALLEQRKASKDFIDELNRLTTEARGIGAVRNRIAHDPAFRGQEEERTYYRLQITADRKLVFAMQPDALEQIREVEKKIRRLIRSFEDWRERTFAALPPFDDTQFRRSPGITPGRLPETDIG
jgi:hypothetical protein